MLIVGAAIAVAISDSSRAESGGFTTMPQQQPGNAPLTSKANGLLLNVDSRWSNTYGYRPIRFEVVSPQPAAADRTITIAYRADHTRTLQHQVTVEEDVDLPAGETSATLAMSAPQLTLDQTVSWRVWVDGKYDRELSLRVTRRLHQPTGTNESLKILSTPTTIGQGASLFSAEGLSTLLQSWRTPPPPGVGNLPLDWSKRPLPSRWLDYSGLDVVHTTAEYLLKDSEKNPDRVDALRRWLASGGTLWLEGAGENFSRLDKVAELLGMEEAPRLDADLAPERQVEGAPLWRWAETRLERTPNGFDFADSGSTSDDTGGGDGQSNQINLRLWFAEATYGFGRVVAFESGWGDQFRQETRRLKTVNTAASATIFGRHAGERAWVVRHGMAPDQPATEFPQLLIPGVGLPPVASFCVLISVFALVAGPLNFWLLRRWQRVQLMVLTVPALSVLLTVALIGYALLADGFGVQARVRSVTLLDQQQGVQTVWARTSYYAGLSPATGLSFSRDTAVYPITSYWDRNTADTADDSVARVLEWRTAARDQQFFGAGWLPSRRTVQFLVVNSGETSARVNFASADEQVTAENQLGADAELLIAVDDAGELWLTEKAPNGQTVELAATPQIDAVGKLRRLCQENAPTTPVGLETASQSPFNTPRDRRIRRQNRAFDQDTVTLSDNLLNQTLARLQGLDGGSAVALPPQSYLAVTKRSVTAPLGLPDVVENGSFHVVIGRW